MVRFVLLSFGIGWAFVLAVAFGHIAQDSKLGFGPLVFHMMATMAGLGGGIEDRENRALLLVLAAASFASTLAYALLRYLMLFGWAGR